jgi:hypothetical protein
VVIVKETHLIDGCFPRPEGLRENRAAAAASQSKRRPRLGPASLLSSTLNNTSVT